MPLPPGRVVVQVDGHAPCLFGMDVGLEGDGGGGRRPLDFAGMDARDGSPGREAVAAAVNGN